MSNGNNGDGLGSAEPGTSPESSPDSQEKDVPYKGFPPSHRYNKIARGELAAELPPYIDDINRDALERAELAELITAAEQELLEGVRDPETSDEQVDELSGNVRELQDQLDQLDEQIKAYRTHAADGTAAVPEATDEPVRPTSPSRSEAAIEAAQYMHQVATKALHWERFLAAIDRGGLVVSLGVIREFLSHDEANTLQEIAARQGVTVTEEQ